LIKTSKKDQFHPNLYYMNYKKLHKSNKHSQKNTKILGVKI